MHWKLFAMNRFRSCHSSLNEIRTKTLFPAKKGRHSAGPFTLRHTKAIRYLNVGGDGSYIQRSAGGIRFSLFAIMRGGSGSFFLVRAGLLCAQRNISQLKEA